MHLNSRPSVACGLGKDCVLQEKTGSARVYPCTHLEDLAVLVPAVVQEADHVHLADANQIAQNRWSKGPCTQQRAVLS